MLVIWNERAKPIFARCGADRRVTSSPAKRMLPASGRRLPASWLMSVVLPAPLGPMMACVSPSRRSRSTPSVAASAPKDLRSPRASRIASAILAASGQEPGEPAPEIQHREHQQRAEDDLPVLGPA